MKTCIVVAILLAIPGSFADEKIDSEVARLEGEEISVWSFDETGMRFGCRSYRYQGWAAAAHGDRRMVWRSKDGSHALWTLAGEGGEWCSEPLDTGGLEVRGVARDEVLLWSPESRTGLVVSLPEGRKDAIETDLEGLEPIDLARGLDGLRRVLWAAPGGRAVVHRYRVASWGWGLVDRTECDPFLDVAVEAVGVLTDPEDSLVYAGQKGEAFRVRLADPVVPVPAGEGEPPAPGPRIESVSSASTRSGFEIDWKTDVPATSEVVFEIAGRFSDPGLVLDHRLTFAGVRGATYRYHVRSTDAAGNVSTAGPFEHRQ